jgi:OFA family oxalate/formate antiporter-like MFS transporter
LVPFANVLQSATGGWEAVFVIAGTSNVFVALLAVAVLRPLRKRVIAVAEPGLSAAVR